jgi:hypothetical protein
MLWAADAIIVTAEKAGYQVEQMTALLQK